MSEAPATVERLILEIAASINARALYPPGHPRVVQAVDRVLASVDAVCAERRRDAVTFLLVEGDLVVDDRPLRRTSAYQRQLLQSLHRLGIEGLTLARGLEVQEYHTFAASMAAGTAPVPSDHITIGHIKVAAAGAGEGEDGQDQGTGGAEPLSTQQLDGAREAFARHRMEPRGGLGEMDKVVWGLMDALARSTREMLPLAPLKSYDEYTFVHSVNVALLVLAQARSFGIQGHVLHAMGTAALVHDIGKLRIPLEVLNKPGRLEAEEWKVMMTHAELGAWHLAGLETSAPLAIIVAYEHHLRYDGVPNYPLLKRPRLPTLASQMTSLADTYDAVSTSRPYQRARSRAVALETLRTRAGTFLDPMLVGTLAGLLGEKPPGAIMEGESTPSS